MLTVFKYPLALANEVNVEMPFGAEVLTVQMQAETPCLWARVDPEAPKETRRFSIRGTGHAGADGRYLATLQMGGGSLVFHVFESGR